MSMDNNTFINKSLFPGQGALAIETRDNDDHLNHILNDINFDNDFFNVENERNILKIYGGSCHQIGVSYITHSLGTIVSKRGEDENGNHFESWDLINEKKENFFVVVKMKYIQKI